MSILRPKENFETTKNKQNFHQEATHLSMFIHIFNEFFMFIHLYTF